MGGIRQILPRLWKGVGDLNDLYKYYNTMQVQVLLANDEG